MIKCKICKKKFKTLTASHVKTHGLTMEQYNLKHEPNKATIKSSVKFINEHYVTARYRFLEYKKSYDNPFTVNCPDDRGWKLCDNDIKEHLTNKRTIGIYFPEYSTKFIGLDIDDKDVYVLNKVYSAIRNYGIAEENFLITFSGKKGYHLDIFLNSAVNKVVVNKFYKALLNDTGMTKEQVELRGGGGQGYKLPLGYHQETEKYCFPCDNFGNEIPLDCLDQIKKLDAQILHDIVDINFSPIVQKNNQLVIEAENFIGGIDASKMYSRNNQNRLENVHKLLENGIHEIGKRHIAIREVAGYCKDHKIICLNETIEFITNWVKNTWSKKISDKDLFKSIRTTVKSIFKNDFKFYVPAKPAKIHYSELREILSIHTDNKLETNALRKLYYILTIHSKAYANKENVFSMTYQQMQTLGAVNQNQTLSKRLAKLAELGKLMVIEKGARNPKAGTEGQFFYKANKYMLPLFVDFEINKTEKIFHICTKPQCKDCIKKATCYLFSDRERALYIKGKAYKELDPCKYTEAFKRAA